MFRVLAIAIFALLGQETTADDTALADVRRRLSVPVAEAADTKKPHWRADWDAACDEARRRNCPVVVVFSDDQSAGLATVDAAIHSRPAFAAFSREVVLVIAFGGTQHPKSRRTTDDGEIDWCGRFDVACDAHRRLHDLVQAKYVTREYWNPIHLFLDGDGKELTRAEGHEIDQARLDHELARARRRLGPGLGATEYAETMRRVKAIVDGREKDGAAGAWHELGDLLAAEERAGRDRSAGPLRTAGMVAWVGQLRECIVEEGEIEVRRALARAAAGDAAGARTQLERLARSFKELAPGRAAAAALQPKK